MAGTTLSDVQTYGHLQRQYSQDVQYMEHFQNALMRFIELDTTVNYDGEAFFVPVNFVINMSYGARNDGEALPVADKSKGVFAQYSSKLMYSTLESTFKAATRGYRGGRPDGQWLDKLVRDTLIACEHEVSNDHYGNGRGHRAYIATATPTATNFTVTSSTRLLPGQKLDWYDSGMTTKRGTIQIDDQGIDRQARTVYIKTTYGTGQVPSGATAGDRLVIEGAADAGEPSDGRHIQGLERITDNSVSIGGLAATSWRAWQSYNENMSSTIISIDVLQRLFDNMKTISGKKVNRWVLNPAQKRQYFNILVAQLRFAGGMLEGGAKGLTFNPVRMGKDMDGETDYGMGGLEILEDSACDLDVMYFWNNADLKRAEDYTTGGPQIAEEDGRTFRFRDGYDTLTAFLRYWSNLIVYKRNAIGKIYGLTTPTGVV
jgi:hypothetical protein